MVDLSKSVKKSVLVPGTYIDSTVFLAKPLVNLSAPNLDVLEKVVSIGSKSLVLSPNIWVWPDNILFNCKEVELGETIQPNISDIVWELDCKCSPLKVDKSIFPALISIPPISVNALKPAVTLVWACKALIT